MKTLGLFNYNFLTKGYLKSTIINTRQKEYYNIPNDLFNFLKSKNNKFEISEINKLYLDELIKKELVFEIRNNENFNNLNLNYVSCSHIDVLIVNLDLINISLLKNICNNYIITNIIFEGNNINFLNEILNLPVNGLVFKFINENLINENILKILQNKKNVISIQFYSNSENKQKSNNTFSFIKSIDNVEISTNDFVIELYYQLENCVKSSSFNKVIYMEGDFIYDIRYKKNKIEVKNILKNFHPEIWKYNKQKCFVCSDCEFSKMCPEKREVFYNINLNHWYHKIECNYNPYIAKWKDEDGYKTLAECGVISNENGFSIDHDKIAEINKELWGINIVQ